MVTNTLSIWNDLRPFQVGFDHIFERFNTQLNHPQVKLPTLQYQKT